MTEGFMDRFKAQCETVDRAQPMRDQLAVVIENIGLAAEHSAASSVAPNFVALADAALMHDMAGRTGKGQSKRSRADHRRREREEAWGQHSLPIDFKGESTDSLKRKLSFSVWLVNGVEMTVDELLADAVARAVVVAELSEEREQAQKLVDVSERDLGIMLELKERAEAVELVD